MKKTERDIKLYLNLSRIFCNFYSNLIPLGRNGYGFTFDVIDDQDDEKEVIDQITLPIWFIRQTIDLLDKQK